MRWVVIHKTNGITDAEILKNMLESFGIPTRLSYEAMGKIYGLTMDGMGVVALLVAEDRAQEAQDILAERFTPES
jgi:hypothetical protein